MHQVVRAVKFCCVGDSPLEQRTIGGATSETTVVLCSLKVYLEQRR